LNNWSIQVNCSISSYCFCKRKKIPKLI